MGTSGDRDCQWASRSVLKYFDEDELTILAGNCEGEVAMARTASLLVELVGVAT